LYIADVYVNLPVKSIAQAYSYIIPDDKLFLDAGWRVVVPFHGRATEGFILNKYEVESTDRPLKKITDVLDDEAWFPAEIIKAASKLATFYLCSLAEIMRLFMPGKSGAKISCVYEVNEEAVSGCYSDGTAEKMILDFLHEYGNASKNKLKKLLPDASVESVIEKMCRRDEIRRVYNVAKKSKERFEKYICPQIEITDTLIQEKFKGKPAQQKILRLLKDCDSVSLKYVKEQGISSVPLKALAEMNCIKYIEKRILRDSYQDFDCEKNVKKIKLTDTQGKIIDSIRPHIDSKQYFMALLHGVTGSGKTQVYVELTKLARMQGRQVIVLVPEIALTGQIVKVFKQNFSEDIVVIHSQLSVSERNDSFYRFRHGQANIAIGARSALFLTPENLGLIIIDEEQDPSYKQDEAPRYHARVVAEMLAKAYNCTLILGSATPSLESYYQTQLGKIEYFEMPERVGNRPMPKVYPVDMRMELKRGNRKILSNDMMRLIRETIQQGQQMILMLNRRGFSTFIMCRECGHVIKCPDCGLPMVYHKANTLMCHHCDTQLHPPSICPQCGSTYIRYFGSGTEKLEAELKELVPEARVVRLDRDTTQRKFSQTEILSAFSEGKYDILLGTQMVAKGHDVPNVTASGILSADAALNLPDFRAAERCFMLIAQTAGRSGRGEIPGKVLVQCYNPEHYAVQYACEQNYHAFFEHEIEIRKALYYPPFCRLIKLTFVGDTEDETRKRAESLKDKFVSYFSGRAEQQIIGPAPDTIPVFRGRYRYNLVIKAGKYLDTLQFMRENNLHEDTNVLIDIDPINI